MAGLLWPIVGHPTTQGFSGTNPFEPAGFLIADAVGSRRARRAPFPGGVSFDHLHGSIDIGCPIGTPVLAPEAGRVVARDTYVSTGEHYLMLEIRPGTILFFTHLSSFSVPKGQVVARGDEIAKSGNTGMSTGPHLHWEVRVTTHAGADPRLSGRWFKWNPRRLREGGDLAGLEAITPLGQAQAVDTPVATDPDPDEIAAPADTEDADSAGDPATVNLMIASGIPFTGPAGPPKPF